MDYVEKNLRKDETVIVKAKISFLYLIPRLILLLVFLAIAIVVNVVLSSQLSDIEEAGAFVSVIGIVMWAAAGLFGGIPFIVRILTIITTHIAVTNKRVIGKQGVLKIATVDIPIDKIDSVSFSANFLGNIFRYATISIKSAGSGSLGFHGISNAQAFKDCVNDAIEKHAAQARKDQAEQIAAAMHK